MCNKSMDGGCLPSLRSGKFNETLLKALNSRYNPLICSPFSVEVLLTMCAAGASGETARALKTVLGFEDLSETTNKYNLFFGDLQRITNPTVCVANKFFTKSQLPLTPTFVNTIQNQFLSEVESVDFSDNIESANTINRWVVSKTNGKITTLISSSSINSNTQLIVINAIYFKGQWCEKFNPEDTVEKSFWLANGTEKKVDMMRNCKKYGIVEDKELNIEILELPYDGGEFSMLIFLPNQRDGITNLKKDLHKINVKELNLISMKVDVEIPKFVIETQVDLSGILKEIGLSSIFDGADFSGITGKPDLFVSEIIQKAFVEVNEEGTEAAVATAAVIMLKSNAHLPKRFIADHEFVFGIKFRDVLLFAGAYS